MTDEVAVHSFLSHLRTGVGAAPFPPGPVPIRRTLAVEIEVNNEAARTAATTVELYGPADVTGLDADEVVRTDPAPGAADVEPNYFPAVEFDAPDLPWRYSPVPAANGRLLPWLTLVVLTEEEATLADAAPGRLPVVVVADPATSLPPSQQRWAWAHVQVADRVGAGTDVVATLAAEPARVVSRLLCPRRLLPLTAYRACVVPAFEAGRLAGLGRDPGTDGAAAAWTAASARGLELPVYFTWTFRTGRGGDFESLVRRLQARELDERVGTRPVHVGPQAYSVPALASPLPLDGALRHVSAPPPPLPDLTPFGTRLGKVLDTAADLANGDPADARIVAPPLYGMWHAAQFRVRNPDTPWLSSLNLDPRRRTTAGLGARVIRENQEQLMAEAWRQVGDVERANEALRRAQLGRSASAAVWQRSVSALGTDTLFALTGPVQGRVRRGTGATTLAADVRASRLPNATVDPAFRRIASPRARLGRRVGLAAAPQLLTRLDQGVIAAAGPPPERPSGMQDADDVPGSGGGGAGGGGVITGGGGVITGGGGIFTGGGGGVISGGGIFTGGGGGVVSGGGVFSGGGVLSGGGVFSGGTPAVLSPAALAAARTRTTTFLTPDRINQLPDRLDFRLTLPGSDIPVGTVTEAPGVEAAAFKAAAVQLQARLAVQAAPVAVAPPAGVGDARADLLGGLDPAMTIPRRVLATISSVRPVRPPTSPPTEDPIEPIMAAPEFPHAMYGPLRDLSTEHLLPGLEHVPPETLALVRTNQAAIEAYLVGLNHEMSRELLWRGYPTDQRGSYFRRFFDATDDDIAAVHTWTPASALGDHGARPATVEEPLVLLVRGELLRRYPTAVIYAMKAMWNPVLGRREFDEPLMKLPLFRGTLPQDVVFVGFDLEPDAARGVDDPNGDQGWFFVVQEQPSEPRFGFDDADAFAPAAPTGWSDLSWGHFAADDAGFAALGYLDLDVDPPHWPWAFDGTGDPPRHWRTRAADMAVATLQQPVRVAVHASRMLP